MPYLRHDQPGPGHPQGFLRRDSYPLADHHFGGVFSANDGDFDYREPYGPFHPGDGDGYDVYRVAEGYVSGSGTRDGGSYRETFFGAGSQDVRGMGFFPVPFPRELRPGASGRGVFPIHRGLLRAERRALSGTMRPDTHFNTETLTTWSFEPGFVFGGVNGAPKKSIDAIVSTHGFPLRAPLPLHFGLERFAYFTDLYGFTRWEVWKPAADALKAPARHARARLEWDHHGVAFKLACAFR